MDERRIEAGIADAPRKLVVVNLEERKKGGGGDAMNSINDDNVEESGALTK